MSTKVSLFYKMFSLPYQKEYDDPIRDELMQKLKDYCALNGLDRPVFIDPGLNYVSKTLNVVNDDAHLISVISDQLSKSNLACFREGYKHDLACRIAYDIAERCDIQIVCEEDLTNE